MQLKRSPGSSPAPGDGGAFFLIGMMGSGKSHWAQKISAAYGIEWVDLDAEIENKTMMTIREIFETEGEEWFRKKEQEVLHELTAIKNMVIATGGGAPCFHGNMEWMNKHGITIWIDETVEVLAERLTKEKDHRPLIKSLSDDELHNFLTKKLAERTPYYSQATHRLQGNKIALRSFAEILQQHE